jgi:hypothetical protein
MVETYSIDTSSLIELKRFARDVFPGVWEKVEELISSGRLVAAEEVRREIERGDDELVRWAKQHRGLFRKPDEAQILAAQQALADFPNLVDPSKEGPDADPFVVALAKAGNEMPLLPKPYTVVSQERRRAIPQACSRYGIECITLIEMFRREGWSFR